MATKTKSTFEFFFQFLSKMLTVSRVAWRISSALRNAMRGEVKASGKPSINPQWQQPPSKHNFTPSVTAERTCHGGATGREVEWMEW